MPPALCFSLTEVKENGEMSVRAETPSETFPDALTEGALLGPITIEGLIRAVDNEAVFSGTAKGRWRFECTRCLVPIEASWNTSLEATAPLEGGPMDLSDEVRQAIALAQPMKIICRPDCRGLCPVCRVNRNDTECGHENEGPPISSAARLTPRLQKG